MRRNANRVASLLRQGGVVDDQPAIIAANQFVGFDQQSRFKRRALCPSASKNGSSQRSSSSVQSNLTAAIVSLINADHP